MRKATSQSMRDFPISTSSPILLPGISFQEPCLRLRIFPTLCPLRSSYKGCTRNQDVLDAAGHRPPSLYPPMFLAGHQRSLPICHNLSVCDPSTLRCILLGSNSQERSKWRYIYLYSGFIWLNTRQKHSRILLKWHQRDRCRIIRYSALRDGRKEVNPNM